MFWDEKKRKSIPMKVKRQVYKRAKGKCEKCGIKLKMNEGDFHHTRDPTVIPRASSVRFLCPLCHRRYGHKRTTKKTETLFGTEKEVRVKRQKVVKIKKPIKKKPKTKRVAIRNFWGDVIGYRTVKTRKPKTKKTTTRKIKKKTTTTKKKTVKKRTKSKTKTKGQTKRRKTKKREESIWDLF